MPAESPAEDDRALVARVSEGDAQAYTELTRRHAPKLLHYAERLLESRAEAEEIVQETLLRLWLRADSYSNETRVTTWLHGIAHHAAVDRLRRRKPDVPVEDGELLPPVSALQPVLLDQKRRAEALDRALATLPERQAAAVMLVHLQGLSGAEAAHILGVGLEALESLLSRARRALKTELARDRGDTA